MLCQGFDRLIAQGREKSALEFGFELIIEVLGSPITDGFLVSGNTNVNGASGEANLSIPVSGPKGKGTIYAAATKSLGRWNYSGLVLEIEKTHQRINLLEEPAPVSSL